MFGVILSFANNRYIVSIIFLCTVPASAISFTMKFFLLYSIFNTAFTWNSCAILLGLIFLLTGLYNGWRLFMFNNRGLTTEAEVDRFKITGYSGRKMYFPYFKYKTLSGKTFIRPSKLGSGPKPAYAAGEKVEIVYDPKNESRFEIKGAANRHYNVIIPLAGGIVLVALGWLELISF